MKNDQNTPLFNHPRAPIPTRSIRRKPIPLCEAPSPVSPLLPLLPISPVSAVLPTPSASPYSPQPELPGLPDSPALGQLPFHSRCSSLSLSQLSQWPPQLEFDSHPQTLHTTSQTLHPSNSPCLPRPHSPRSETSHSYHSAQSHQTDHTDHTDRTDRTVYPGNAYCSKYATDADPNTETQLYSPIPQLSFTDSSSNQSNQSLQSLHSSIAPTPTPETPHALTPAHIRNREKWKAPVIVIILSVIGGIVVAVASGASGAGRHPNAAVARRAKLAKRDDCGSGSVTRLMSREAADAASAVRLEQAASTVSAIRIRGSASATASASELAMARTSGPTLVSTPGILATAPESTRQFAMTTSDSVSGTASIAVISQVLTSTPQPTETVSATQASSTAPSTAFSPTTPNSSASSLSTTPRLSAIQGSNSITTTLRPATTDSAPTTILRVGFSPSPETAQRRSRARARPRPDGPTHSPNP